MRFISSFVSAADGGCCVFVVVGGLPPDGDEAVVEEDEGEEEEEEELDARAEGTAISGWLFPSVSMALPPPAAACAGEGEEEEDMNDAKNATRGSINANHCAHTLVQKTDMYVHPWM